jgi:23S rRNA (adenine2503-C2)-methyltransferase
MERFGRADRQSQRAPGARPAIEPRASLSRTSTSSFNPWPDTHQECSDRETIEGFARLLNRIGSASPIRTPRGRAVLAACRQLRSESVKAKASERLKAHLAEKAASAES